MRVANLYRVAVAGLMMALGVAAWQGSGMRAAVVTATDGAMRHPVLVELFTSEGCSSCPPADALLSKLDATQFVPGAEAIVLSEHVTYWDHLGWRDPNSLEAMTQRQQQYATRFGLDSVYTPQVVVDGAEQLVGSDQRGLAKAIAKSAAVPKADLTIQQVSIENGTVRFSLHTDANGSGKGLPKGLLVAALAEDTVESSVTRGENEGRTLRHVAVVRVMKEMAAGGEDGRQLVLDLPAAERGHSQGGLRLVIFSIDRHSGRVLALAERTI